MRDDTDPVDAAFDELRTDTQHLDVRQPRKAITGRGGARPYRAILGFGAAIAVVLGSFALLRDSGGDVVAGPETDTASEPPGLATPGTNASDGTTTSSTVPEPTDANLLAGTDWVLVRGEGPDGPVAIPTEAPPTILFPEPGRLTGSLGCNDFDADVTLDSTRLAVSTLRQTAQGCLEPGVTFVETFLADALLTVTEYYVADEGDSLVMTGEAIELRFETLNHGAQQTPPAIAGGLTVTELLDTRPTGPVTVLGSAIDLGGGWIICGRIDDRVTQSCRSRSVVVTNFDPNLDTSGPGSWDGSLIDDGRFVLSGRDPGIEATDQQMAIARALADISVSETTVDTGDLPLAPTMLIGLGAAVIEERTPEQLTDPANWSLEAPDGFRGGEGPVFFILDAFDRPTEIDITVGPHSHCASPPAPISDRITAVTHLSIQPTQIDSCLMWFTVDIFLDGNDRIVAITLDYWEP